MDSVSPHHPFARETNENQIHQNRLHPSGIVAVWK